jgi:hypothetical protein
MTPNSFWRSPDFPPQGGGGWKQQMQTYRDILEVLAEFDVWKVAIYGREPLYVRLSMNPGLGSSIRIAIAKGTPLEVIRRRIAEAEASLKHLII